MKAVKTMSQAELAAFVQTHLRGHGVRVVLSGGAAVSIYSDGKYVSLDLDLVNVYSARRRVLSAAMSEIGFREQGRHFKHPDSEFLVEFPPGPLAIGSEPIRGIQDIALATGTLTVITPTECVKDRLAAYFHWGDRQCLVQAIMVAEQHEIDLAEIRRWSQAEGFLEAFERIRARLAGQDQDPAV